VKKPIKMNASVAVIPILVLLGYFFACVNVILGAAGDTANGGRSVDGLRLRLQFAVSKDPRKAPEHFSIVIENVSSRDLNVKLGHSLNNGRSHHPDSLQLIARANGVAPLRLIYFNGEGGIGGRADPFVVPLPVGASYTLRCPFKNYVDPQSLRPIDLKERDYRIAVSLTGKPVTRSDVNLDTLGQTMIACWQGTIQSNDVRILPSTPENFRH
jgi:hypothetical protein